MRSKPPPLKPLTTPQPYHHGNLREALLIAAAKELEERGIEGFSLRGVAKRAGVSHAAPAHHFHDANGLLTALAAVGFDRFMDVQRAYQGKTGTDGLSRLVAGGLGYIAFARANPALFRLMFSSDRPNHEDPALCTSAGAALAKLIADVRGAHGAVAPSPAGGAGLQGAADPAVLAAWALAHGLADLVVAGRLPLLDLPLAEQDAALEEILRRSLA